MIMARFMPSRLLLGLAIAVSATRGFLLPTTVSPTDIKTINSIPVESFAQVKEQTLDLKCTDCPVPRNDESGALAWVQGVDSDLRLTFSITNTGTDGLSLNGVQVYPPRDLSTTPLMASQITADGQTDLVLGYELNVKPVAMADNDQIELISVQFQVVEIADRFINGLENVELKLVKLPSGKLLMGSLTLQPTQNPIINPIDGGEECTTLICRWRAVISKKLSQLKKAGGCGSKTHAKHTKHAGHKTHKHHGHHGHHQKHQRIAKFFVALKQVAIHVLIPVFIGIALGQCAIVLARALYRRRQDRSYKLLPQFEADVSATNLEAKPQVDAQEMPPVYEAVMDEKSEL